MPSPRCCVSLLGLAAALDPREVFDFLDQRVEDVGGIFLGEVDAVFRAGDEGDEGLDGVAGLGAEGGGEIRIAECLPDGFVVFAAPVGGEHGGGLADAAVGRVEDAEQRHVGIRRGEQLGVGEHVADLAAVVETLRADHAVGDLALAQGELEFAALAVGAEQHGEVLPLAADGALAGEDFLGDELGLLVVAGHGDDAHGIAALAGGAEDLLAAAEVVSDQAVGGVEDGVGGAVVLLQADDLRVWEKALEFEDVGDFRAAPAVDRLVVVADDADVVGRADELLEQAHLERVGVLELIHGDAGEALAEVLADVLVLAEDLLAEEQEVVEIHGVLGAEFVLIGDGEDGEEIVLEFGGIEALVFRLGDRAEHGRRVSPSRRCRPCGRAVVSSGRPGRSAEQMEKFFL